MAERGDRVISGRDATGPRLSSIFPTFFVGLGGCGTQIVDEIRGFIARSPHSSAYKDLVHYFGFDTDQDELQSLKNIDPRHRFLLSDFPKGEYVRMKTGRSHAAADPFFTSWWPEWYRARPDSTKGAGQIRVESRLSLYYQLEDDRQGIIQRIREAISTSLDHDNPYRKSRPATAYVYIYGSLAGGTGSGGLLTLAYLMRELLEERRFSPVVNGIFALPTLFYGRVKAKLIPDIQANGYSALKELEYLMTLGYNRNPRELAGLIESEAEDSVAFNYNPFNKETPGETRVRLPPFHSVYLMDEPTGFSFSNPKQIYPAIAAASYVQLFSPIIGRKEGEEDNYYKKLKSLDPRGFSLGYGAFGLSMLVVPERELVLYCAKRFAAHVLRSQVKADGPGSETADSRAQAWSQLATVDAEQRADANLRRLDQWVQERMSQVLTRSGEDARRTGRDGRIAYDPEEAKEGYAELDLDRCFRRVDEFRGGLRRQVEECLQFARDAADGPQVNGILYEQGPGSEEFRRYVVARVYLLAATHRQHAVDVNVLVKRLEDKVAKVVADERRQALQQKKRKTGLERIVGDKDFGPEADGYNNELDAALREVGEGLRAAVQQTFYDELWSVFRTQVEELGAQGNRSLDLAKALEERAARLLREADLGRGDLVSHAHEYVLDDEALRGLYTRRRHWDRFFEEHVLVKVLQKDDEGAVYNEVTRTAAGPDDLDAQEQRVTEAAVRLVSGKLLSRRRSQGRADADAGLSLQKLLELEAEYELREQYVRQHQLHDIPHAHQRTEDVQRLEDRFLPHPDEVESYVGAKIEFVARKAQILARLRSTETLAVDPMNFIALHRSHEEWFAKLRGKRDIFKNVKLLDDWNDERRIVFFNAQVGLPVHNFYPVVGELQEAYEHIYGQYVRPRDFPSHIDRQFEDPNEEHCHARLPSLDPSEIPRIRESSVTSFLTCWVLDALEVGDEAVQLHLSDKKNVLVPKDQGRPSLHRAFVAFRRRFFPDGAEVEKMDEVARNAHKQERYALEKMLQQASSALLGAGSERDLRERFNKIRAEFKRREEEDHGLSNLSRKEKREQRLRARFAEVLGHLETRLLDQLDDRA